MKADITTSKGEMEILETTEHTPSYTMYKAKDKEGNIWWVEYERENDGDRWFPWVEVSVDIHKAVVKPYRYKAVRI